MNISLQKMLRALAMVGMLAIIAANFFPVGPIRSSLVIAGCITMAISPFYEKQLFFAYLQLVALSGALVALTSFSLMIKSLIPLSLALGFTIHFYRQNFFSERFQYLGGLGISLLGLGYGVQHPLIYLLGGLALAIHASITFRKGVQIALLWAILNAFFVMAVIYNVLHYKVG